MDSSTSNFKQTRSKQFLYSLLFAALLLCVTEVFSRTLLIRLSKDFSRFYSYKAQADRVSQSRPYVAAIGNSVTEHGIEPQIVQSELNLRSSHPIKFASFYAHSSDLNTWYYMTKNYFWESDHDPNMLIINFAENWLEHSTNYLVQGRSAQFLVSPRDRFEVIRDDLQTFDERAEFIMCSLSATYGNRDLMVDKVFTLVPGYWDYRKKATDTPPAQSKLADKAALAYALATQEIPNYEPLQRLLAMGKKHHCKICFVAYPLPSTNTLSNYSVRPKTIALIREYGMIYLDMRHTPGITLDSYEDELHMNPKGAAIYSKALAERLTPLLES